MHAMKRRWTVLLATALVFSFSTPRVCAADVPRPEGVATDVLVVRPLCFVATAAGAVVFVVALPFAAIAHNIPETAETLVNKPARLTFCRKLGDFEPLRHDAIEHNPRH